MAKIELSINLASKAQIKALNDLMLVINAEKLLQLPIEKEDTKEAKQVD